LFRRRRYPARTCPQSRGRDGDGAVWHGTRRLRFLADLLSTDLFATLSGLSNNGLAVGTSGDNVHSRVVFWPGYGALETLLPLSRH
jgi:hypothetical protein